MAGPVQAGKSGWWEVCALSSSLTPALFPQGLLIAKQGRGLGQLDYQERLCVVEPSVLCFSRGQFVTTEMGSAPALPRPPHPNTHTQSLHKVCYGSHPQPKFLQAFKSENYSLKILIFSHCRCLVKVGGLGSRVLREEWQAWIHALGLCRCLSVLAPRLGRSLSLWGSKPSRDNQITCKPLARGPIYSL